MGGGFEVRGLLRAVKKAFPDSPETWRDVVHVEAWEYAMKRFSEGGTPAEIYAEIDEVLRVKSGEDARSLVRIVERARSEWRDMIPGARVVTM